MDSNDPRKDSPLPSGASLNEGMFGEDYSSCMSGLLLDSEQKERMTSRQTQQAECKHCGALLTSNHVGPCPECGQTGKHVTVTLHDRICLTDNLQYTRVHEYYEKNPRAKWAVVSVTVVSSLIGLILSGFLGIIAGLILGAVSYVIGPKAIMKIREVTRG